MLRVVAKIETCNDIDTCPQIVEVPGMAGDVLVQGYDDVDPSVTAEAGTPAGERLVRVPRAMLIEAGRRLERERLFEEFTHSAFRLETLPQYQLTPESDERFRAFLAGEPLPERTPTNSPWLARIRASTAAGRIWTRAHIVSQPLSKLMQFELTTDLENVEAGERVYVADSAIYPWMKGLTQDFWLLDGDEPTGATVLLMRYDRQGRFLNAEISTDHDVIRRCRRRRDMVLARVIPVADYLDQIGLEPARVG